MTSLVTGYSSEEEEELESAAAAAPPRKQPRQKDVNYDDVNMDMSESEEETKRKKKVDKKTIEEESSEERSSHKKKKKKKKKSKRRTEEELEEEEEKEEIMSSKSTRREERSREDEEEEERGDKHRRKHRKRSRERRRSRERPSREDPDDNRFLSKQGRKLKALGLPAPCEPETSNNAHSSSTLGGGGGGSSGLNSLPKYYNPSAINSSRYAEQIKKRKLLWSKPDADKSNKASISDGGKSRGSLEYYQNESNAHSYNNWESTNFGNNQANEKFRRLMGIKSGAGGGTAAGAAATSSSSAGNKSTEGPSNKKMFKDLDQQYEKARITTHTARGLGLGFNNPLLHGGDDQYAKLPRK
eukprot:TRINITY_DN3201_c0_g1_i1.p1 TRINITY_DN3201_c0_g1~~TRINITY_DN3201_c0_g1_i1.p1  ORF type:complete len:356 (+),score=132.30 TRINITY_DN3201_c0_g1_i1:100-1167(+)